MAAKREKRTRSRDAPRRLLSCEDRRLKKIRGIQNHFDVSDVMEEEEEKKTLLCHMLADGSEGFFESCSAPGDDGSSRSVTNAERRGKLSKLRVSNTSETTPLSENVPFIPGDVTRVERIHFRTTASSTARTKGGFESA